jgi:hypothetical protein
MKGSKWNTFPVIANVKSCMAMDQVAKIHIN